MQEKSKKIIIGLIKVMIILLILIAVTRTTLGNMLIEHKSYDEGLTEERYKSADELLMDRYSEYNYEYICIDNYYFVSCTQNNLLRSTYIYEVIYINNTNDEFEYNIIFNGINFDIHREKHYVGVREETENGFVQHALCFIEDDDSHYIFYIVDTKENIVQVSDNYNEFKSISSSQYDIKYYFNVLEKSKFSDNYRIQFDIKDIGIMGFGREEIEIVLDK